MSKKKPTLTERVEKLELGDTNRLFNLEESITFYKDCRTEKEFRSQVQIEIEYWICGCLWLLLPYVITGIIGCGIGAILITICGGN